MAHMRIYGALGKNGESNGERTWRVKWKLRLAEIKTTRC